MNRTTNEIPGYNVLLVGGSGSGKTHSIQTLVEAGIKPFVIFTEPGMEVIMAKKEIQWHYIPPANVSLKSMMAMAKASNTFDYKTLSNLADPHRSEHHQFYDVLDCLAKPIDDRTGEELPPVDDWDSSRALIIDSLSGLSIMAMGMVAGIRPVRDQATWGQAMNWIELLLQRLCLNTNCHFICMAHLEREIDELTGGTTLMPSTLGRKLAPKLSRYFSDIIHCVRNRDQFVWSNLTLNTDLKKRNLPFGDKIPPSFVEMTRLWKQQIGS